MEVSMFRIINPLGLVLTFGFFVLWAGFCFGDIVLRSPEAHVSEGDRVVEITWTDPNPEDLTFVPQPMLGTPQFPWLGHAGITSRGFYTGACDWSYDVVVISSPDSITLRWSEVVDWGTKSVVNMIRRVDETDVYYDLSDGIELMVVSDGLFEIDASGWSGPIPVFHGIYRGAIDTIPDMPVVIDFYCVSGGEIDEAGGAEVILDWQDDMDRNGSIAVTQAAVDIELYEGLRINFPSGILTEGEGFSLTAMAPLINGDRLTIRPVTFEGYLVLRHSVEDRSGQYKVISRISRCENPELFEDENGEPDPYGTRYFIDKGIDSGPGVVPDPNVETVLNGFPYDYSVVTYDWLGNDSLATSPVEWTRVFPAAPPPSSPKNVYVVPNPYTRRAGWEMGESKIQFVNVPRNSVISIFDASGGYINTVRPNQMSDGTQAGTVDWNLRDSDGEDVVSGIYLYKLESGGGEKFGRFIVVR
jgi:hypothetical protein